MRAITSVPEPMKPTVPMVATVEGCLLECIGYYFLENIITETRLLVRSRIVLHGCNKVKNYKYNNKKSLLHKKQNMNLYEHINNDNHR
jgi:hypothetical protein